jgi:hypothetical protein
MRVNMGSWKKPMAIMKEANGHNKLPAKEAQASI